ncbi:GAF and ANTAR domain-containing protein [Myceligenerans cantabricum]
MTRTPADTLADAVSALVHEHDTSDILDRLIRDAAHLISGSAGLLVRPADGAPLEVLAVTDHATTHLEIYQKQKGEGPCVEVCATGQPVVATGAADILSRWPEVGQAILNAGFEQVYAYPLAWQGKVLGGLNIFGPEVRVLDSKGVRTARAFADMLTLVVAQPDVVPDQEIYERLARVLEGRVVVEQAKGVIAHGMGVDMPQAYDNLLRMRESNGETLMETAQRVVAEAYRR